MAKAMKHNVQIEVTTLAGNQFNAHDGEGKKYGTHALQNFLHHETVEIIQDETETVYVPFHAIENVDVVITSGEETYTDDTCVQE